MTTRHGIALGILLVATTWAFFPLFGDAEFLTWDDATNIVYKPAVQGWSSENLAAAWNGSTLSQGLFEPVSVMLQMVTIQLFGLEVRPFHITTLAIHVMNAWLLYWLALLLIRNCDASLREKLRPEWAALVAALLFALNPMRVEVVAWATGQSYALAALFLLLSLVAYVRYVEVRVRPGAGRPLLFLSLSVFAYACATLSKSAAIFLPPALLLLDYFPFRRRLERGMLLDKLPHALVGTGLFAVIWHITADKQGNGYFALGPWARIAYAIHKLPFHLGKTLWPASVHPAYGVSLTNVGPFTGPLLFSTAIALVLVGSAWLLRRQAPWITCALGIYMLGILPVSGLFAHGDWLLGADRYAYMPLLGIWIVIGAALTAKPLLPELAFGDLRSRSVATVLLVVLVTWGITTFRVTRQWGYSQTLWSYTLQVDPGNRVALQNLGTVYMMQQRYEEALPLLSSAMRLDPGHNFAVPLNLGVALQNLDRMQEAIRVYESALVYNPRSAELHNNLAAAYWKLGDKQHAEVELRLSQELQAEAATLPATR